MYVKKTQTQHLFAFELGCNKVNQEKCKKSTSKSTLTHHHHDDWFKLCAHELQQIVQLERDTDAKRQRKTGNQLFKGIPCNEVL